MLEKYFSAPKTLARLRSGPSGPYIDGFAEALERDSYSPLTAVRYLRAAAHFGRFLGAGAAPSLRLMQARSTPFIATCPAVTALPPTAEETNTTHASGRNGFTATWSEQGFANPAAVRMLTG